MKPCIILHSKPHQRLEAFGEDGRMLAKQVQPDNEQDFELFLNLRGYEAVGFNSRLGRTILDKVEKARIY